MDVAVPVIVEDRYLGAVMFGEVRIPNGNTDAKVERLVSEISSFQAESSSARQDLLEMYNQLPEMEYNRIVAIAETISAFVHYIVDQALSRRSEAMTYEWLLRSTEQTAVPLPDIQELPGPVLETASVGRSSPIPKTNPIYSAVEYINSHVIFAIPLGM